MTIKLRDTGGTLRNITQIRVRDSGGTLRTISRVRGRDEDGVLHTLWSVTGSTIDGDVVLNTYERNGTASGAAGNGTVTTASVTATPQYGMGAYTYEWYKVGGIPVVINTPNAATTTFSATAFDGTTRTATFRCKVTDGTGRVEESDLLTVNFEWTDTR